LAILAEKELRSLQLTILFQPPMSDSLKSHTLCIIVLVLTAIGAFARSLKIEFVGDDLVHIENAWDSLTDIGFHYFRFLTILTLITDNLIWAYNHSGYHLTNLLMHTTNVILVYLLALKFIEGRFFAFVAALLFLFHPIHSMSIFWISGRVDVLCTTFYLLAFMSFVEYSISRTTKFLILAAASFLFALLSKEMALSLPLVLTAYVLVYSTGQTKPWKSATIETWPFWAIAIVFVCFRLMSAGLAGVTGNVHTNIAPVHLLKNLATFIGLLIVPGGQIGLANYLKANPDVFATLAALSILLLVASLRWISRQKHLWFFSLFVLLTLLPVMRLAMRWYLYLPSVGFCLAVAYLLRQLYVRGDAWKRAAIGIAAIIALVYAYFLIVEQNRWLHSGRLAKKITMQITGKINEDKTESCLILSVPGEYEETPVLMHGFESLVNYRLRTDFDYQAPVRVLAASLFSIRNCELDCFPEIIKKDSNVFILSLKHTESFFVFPEILEITSQKKTFRQGYDIAQEAFGISVDSVNQFGMPVSLALSIKDSSLRLYYLAPSGLEPLQNVIENR